MEITAPTEAQQDVLNQLREAGFALILWSPEELQDTPVNSIEDRSTEFGWGIIEDYGGKFIDPDGDDELEDLPFELLPEKKQ